MKNTSRLILAVLGGIAVGAAIGVLFAPGKGSETRRKISDKANELGDKAKDSFRKAAKTANDIKTRANEQVEELV